ncbi:hypothetical protein IV203_019745 [Nitzschia inconspicua]|uniref:Uncharacterized protein n=1 Tax=Nitzschia inconspicua TaxID=303405 RepID=A0A9K3M0G9_9STRA|nr:hypothetical protein IV203_019745 [Nitzschia inconspicua]
MMAATTPPPRRTSRRKLVICVSISTAAIPTIVVTCLASSSPQGCEDKFVTGRQTLLREKVLFPHRCSTILRLLRCSTGRVSKEDLKLSPKPRGNFTEFKIERNAPYLGIEVAFPLTPQVLEQQSSTPSSMHVAQE